MKKDAKRTELSWLEKVHMIRQDKLFNHHIERQVS